MSRTDDVPPKATGDWTASLGERERMRFAGVLGAATTFGADTAFAGLPPDRHRRALAAGVRLLDDWEAAVDALLEGAMSRFMDTKGVWSDRKVFGALYEWLEGEGASPAYRPLRERVRTWAVEHLPVGEGYVFLGEPFGERVVHSVHSYHREKDIHPKRLRKLLLAAGVIDPSSDGLSDARTLFRKDAAEAAQGQVDGLMTLAAAARYLNAPRPHDRLLLDGGFIEPVVTGSKTGDTKHAFSKASLDAFLDRLGADASPLSPRDEGLHAIPPTAKRANCSAAEIVRLLLDGQLARVRRDPGASGYLSVLIDPDEVLSLVRRPDHGCLSLREATRVIGTDDSVLRKLVELGHLPSREAVNPVKRRTQTVVHPDDARAFGARYVSLTRSAAERGESPAGLAARLRAAGVEAAMGLSEVGATFYVREDIEAAFDVGPSTDPGESGGNVGFNP